MADQGLSSLSNLVLTALVARSSSPTVFGVFGLAFLGYLCVLGVSRAVASEPLVVRFGAATPEQVLRQAGPAMGSALIIGFVGGASIAICGLMTRGEGGHVFLILGVSLPLLLLQDACRFAFIAARSPRHALENDAAWIVVEAVALGALAWLGSLTAGTVVLAWAFGGATAGLLACLRMRSRPRIRQASEWLRDSRGFIVPYIGEFVVATVAPMIATICVVAIIGLEGAAALRGAQTLYGPITMLEVGAVVVMIAEGTRLQGSERLGPFLLAGTALTVAAAIAWSAVAILLPASLGHVLLGRTWPLARAIAFPMGLVVAVNGLKSGAVAAIRSSRQTSVGVVLRLAVAPSTIAAGAIGAVLDGIAGAVYAQALAGLLASVAWWLTYRQRCNSASGRRAPMAFASAGSAQ